MKTRVRITLILTVFLILFVSACATPTPEMIVETVVVEKTVEVEVDMEKVVDVTEETLIPATPLPTAAVPGGASHVFPAVASRPNRLIVKNADMQLTVEDTDIAIDRMTQVVGDTGGYIISSRVWYQDWLGESYKYASMTVGIPVDRFETAMRRLRGLALTVDDERAGGQDVTDEYVDLDSRLGNLEATRDRIREFLDQADSVEESLRVNEELARVEAEIEAVKGRMNYLFDRASYSTITMQISPLLPDIPTPPTPTPTPAPEPWRASAVAADASQALSTILQVLAELIIWFSIVVLPLALPVALVVLAVRFVMKRLGA